MNRCAIIVTHHKTGTVWMNSTFRAICAALGIRFVDITKEEIAGPKDINVPVVLFHSHSKDKKIVPPWVFTEPEYRIFHIIRDPRDVIVSAMHYHRVAREPWLHEPREKFGGLTYQQKINGLSSDYERYLFEMSHGGGRVAREMRRWRYGRQTSFECKYEDLIEDTQMVLFAEAVMHLGFSDSELTECQEQFWRQSIFGGRAKRVGKNEHVRSGAARQWPALFDRDIGQAFASRFGDILIELGYESDNSWIDRLPSSTRLLDDSLL